MRHLILTAALALAAGAAPAQETESDVLDRVREPDLARLVALDDDLGGAVLAALQGGAPADVAVLAAALSGVPGPLDPVGDWDCRTIKLGLPGLAIVVYQPFRCRITATDDGWRIEKLTGSQRLQGDVVAVDGGTLYTGVGFVAGGPAVDYAGLPPLSQDPVEPGQTHPQVGRFEQAGADSARLLLADPILESRIDILWLTR